MTPNRKYEKNVPVLISDRCVERLNLIQHEQMRQLLRQAIERYAELCGVAILAWSFLKNHWHIVVRQDIDDHDKQRKRGIAAFMRNVKSYVALKGNAFRSLQGRFWERTYRARTLPTKARLIRALAYIHGQHEHHRTGQSSATAGWNSTQSYTHADPCGLVAQILELIPDADLSHHQLRSLYSELFRRIITQATAAEQTRTRDKCKANHSPWIDATDSAIQALNIPDPEQPSQQLSYRSVDDYNGYLEHRHAQALILDFSWTPVPFQPRPAPTIEHLIREHFPFG